MYWTPQGSGRIVTGDTLVLELETGRGGGYAPIRIVGHKSASPSTTRLPRPTPS